MMTRPIEDARARLERQLAAPKNIRFDNDGRHELIPDADAADIHTVLASLDAATTERDAANERSLANNILAHGWMVAHDMLKAGKPYKFPEPADVPNSTARAIAAESERDALKQAMAKVVEERAVVRDMHEAAEAERDALRKELAEAVTLTRDAWGALNFILAFYEPGQNYLDTNAWKQAEAKGRIVHSALDAFVSRQKEAGRG